MDWFHRLRAGLGPLGRVLRPRLDSLLRERGPRMGAAPACCTLSSLAPLLPIVVSAAGLAWGGEAVRGELVEQLGLLLGAVTAAAETWWKPWFGPWLYSPPSPAPHRPGPRSL